MSNSAFYIRANAFKKVDGQSRQGTDLARLYGTSQIDQFRPRPPTAISPAPAMTTGPRTSVTVIAYGNGGPRFRQVCTTPAAADTYVGTPTYGVLYGTVVQQPCQRVPRVEV